MLKWAIFFMLLSLISGIFGFSGLASVSATLSKFLFFICIVTLIFGLVIGYKVIKMLKSKI